MHMSIRIRKQNRSYRVVAKSRVALNKIKTIGLKPSNSKRVKKSVKAVCEKPKCDEYKALDITVSSWIERWYDMFKRPNISVTTQRSYEGQIRAINLSEIGRKGLKDISPIDVQNWINDISYKSPLSGEPLSPKSVKNMFHTFDAAMKKAEDLFYIPKNPCNGTILPKQRKYKAVVYDERDTERLLEACKDTDMEVPVMLAVILGLRRGELLALKWGHIDFKKLTISVKENMVEVTRDVSDSRTMTKDPKSENGTRTIKITRMLAGLLKKYENICIKEKQSMGVKHSGDDYVVCNKNGEPYLPNTFSKKFRRFLIQNDLKIIRFHDLRHTNATMMLKNGISAKEAQMRLGHSDVSITLGTYSHVLKSMEKNSANKIENSILGLMDGKE